MTAFDFEQLNARNDLKLDLGAGGKSMFPGYLSIDISDDPGVDIREDIFVALAAIKNDKVSSIISTHFFEHIDPLDKLLREVVRVCKNGARIEIVVPHYSNPHFYSDVTHNNFFGLYSFCYLSKSLVKFKRQVPEYAQISNLYLDEVFLEFGSNRPHYIRHAFKKAIERVANISSFTKEFHEEMLTWIFPPSQIRYLLHVQK